MNLCRTELAPQRRTRRVGSFYTHQKCLSMDVRLCRKCPCSPIAKGDLRAVVLPKKFVTCVTTPGSQAHVTNSSWRDLKHADASSFHSNSRARVAGRCLEYRGSRARQ